MDPRYPIELMGLVGNRIRNVIIENLKVEYRGGLFRPFFMPVPEQCIKAGETLTFAVVARQPAYEASDRETDGRIYNEISTMKNYTVHGITRPMQLKTGELPRGACFDTSSFLPWKACYFTWIPTSDCVSDKPYKVTFIADDGIIPVQMDVMIRVEAI